MTQLLLQQQPQQQTIKAVAIIQKKHRKKYIVAIYIMQKYLAEFLGSLFFIYVILATGNPIAIGASLTLIVLLASNISGGHVNPMVSLVMASIGKLDTRDLIPYMIAQVLGGLVGLEIYKRYQL
jgi:glycerol uptake facilitator-like aquaporin